MSRDPLEGVRPSDIFDPAEMRPHDALDEPVAPSPVRPASPGRSSTAMVVMLIGILLAVAGGAMAFYLTGRGSSPPPRPTPSVQPAPTAQPNSNSADDIVQQGAAPAAAK